MTQRRHPCSSCGGSLGENPSGGYCRTCATNNERERRRARRRELVELVAAAKAVRDADDRMHPIPLDRLRRAVAPFLILLILGTTLWIRGSTGNVANADALPDSPVAVATKQAVRGPHWQETPLPIPPIADGSSPLASRFAPAGLDGCDEMTWYRINAGLPARFDALGWRESNCRNEDAVRTFCCHGYWQLYIGLWLTDHRMAPRLAACGVDSAQDVNSDTPGDKWRQGCAAKAAFDVVGYSAWASS